MAEWLIVMEAQSKAPVYSVLLDVLERRLGARRILRTAWVIEAASAQAVYESLLYYRPFDDGLLVLPFAGERVERNLRVERSASVADAAGRARIAIQDQETPR